MTCGFVGNSVAAPVITTLGMRPLLIDTISLAAHPGYGTIAGGPADQTQFSAILEALTTLRVLPQINSVVTGYLGDASQADPIHSMIRGWQAERPDGVYILDPVLGDNGRIYVDNKLVTAMRDNLLPLANFVTPNQFELELLSGKTVRDVPSADKAAYYLLEQYPQFLKSYEFLLFQQFHCSKEI